VIGWRSSIRMELSLKREKENNPYSIKTRVADWDWVDWVLYTHYVTYNHATFALHIFFLFSENATQRGRDRPHYIN
jgi:hypothetical protein